MLELGDLSLNDTVEATYLADRRALALWGTDTQSDETVELALPAGSQVRRRRVPVATVPVADALDTLASLPADAEVTASVRAWSAATRLALHLVSRGRLVPSITDDGLDQWRVGPFDGDDHARVAQLVDALPAAAHALVTGTGPVRIAEPGRTVGAYLDAVADVMVRTAAAPLAAGHDTFASTEPTDVEFWRHWLSTTAGDDGASSARLRVELDDDAVDAPFRAVLELQSHLDPGLVLPAAALWAADPAVQARFGDTADVELLLTLRRAARVWGPIGRLLDTAAPDQLELDDVEVDELFDEHVTEGLAAAGLEVLWPAEVLAPVELRPVVQTKRPGSAAGPGFDLASVAKLRWRATIDGDDLTDDELDALAEAKRPMVRVRGRWVRADPAKLARLREQRDLRAGQVLAASIGGRLTVDGETVDAHLEGPFAELGERLLAFDPRREIEPVGLAATLRPYQRRGVAWLAEMAELGLGGILADDMGLGKTIQVLGLQLERRRRGPTLVVCPATLLGNWEREAARFAPGLAVRRYHGTDRELDDLIDGELVVTTYGVARRDAELLAAVPWDLVVADEAQAVKNPYSRAAKALRAIPSAARIALTGTPVENRLSDLWALLDWTTPGLLGPLEAFNHHVAIPVERDRDPDVTEHLARVVSPFLLRRRKSDPEIAPDLPPKTETDRYVGLTTEQATLYKAVVTELLSTVSASEGIDRRGRVLKLLTALKQVCNHPAHYLGQDGPLPGRSGKLDAACDLLGVIVDEGDSALVFTQFVAMGHLLTARLGQLGIASQFLHGATPVARRDEMVDAFQTGHPQVFVVSLKAGGTGLNLTRATHVVHYDRWWNPAVEDQASDRAWRIGQHRPVQVHRLVCEGTLEERIAVLLESKRELADSVLGGGEAWITELSDDELAALVGLGDDI